MGSIVKDIHEYLDPLYSSKAISLDTYRKILKGVAELNIQNRTLKLENDTLEDLIGDKLKENAELVKKNQELLQENDKLKKQCEFYKTAINLNADDDSQNLKVTTNLKVPTVDNYTVTTTLPPGSGVC